MLVSFGEDSIEFFNIFTFIGDVFRRLFGFDTERFINFFEAFFSFYLLFALLLSILLIFAIVIVYIKLGGLMKEESDTTYYLSGEDTPPSVSTRRWDKVLELLSSDNPGDWKLAVLEADVMLDDMVSRMGYKGETLGDKLKNIESSDFRTIEKAWDAHKVRNIIAHQGSDFILTKREAQKTINLFAEVFEEFHYI